MAQRRSPAGEEGISPGAPDGRNTATAEKTLEAAALPAISAAEIVGALSEGLDLAEGREAGHAKRVCYIAMSVAQTVALKDKDRLPLRLAALLHDVGVPAASAGLSQLIGLNEDGLFSASPKKSPEELAAECPSVGLETIVGAFHRHCTLGGEATLFLGLPREAAEAVSNSHEHWDGSGYPEGLAAKDIPLAARIIALADWTESVISDQSSSLVARRNTVSERNAVRETELDPSLVECIA